MEEKKIERVVYSSCGTGGSLIVVLPRDLCRILDIKKGQKLTFGVQGEDLIVRKHGGD